MIDDSGEMGFDPSEQLPILQAIPRYLLIDKNELRSMAFKKHTAQFICAKLDFERDGSALLTKEYESVFIDSESFEAMKSYFMAFKQEIVVISDSRDYIDWLRCAFYGEENGCQRFNAKPNLHQQVLSLKAEVFESRDRNFWQRLVYLFKGE